MTRYSLQRLGTNIKSQPIPEISLQHFGAGKTDRTVGTGVGRVRSSFSRQRKPARIGRRSGIAVFARQPNRSHRAPESVRVLSLEETDRGVGEADVQQSKQARALRQVKIAP